MVVRVLFDDQFSDSLRYIYITNTKLTDFTMNINSRVSVDEMIEYPTQQEEVINHNA